MSDSVPCELLPWDTEFFGFRIARVHGDTLTPEKAAQVEEWCGRNRIQGLYFLSRSDNPATIRAAEQHGFQLMDVRLAFELALDGQSKPMYAPRSDSARIRVSRPDDVSALRAVAAAAHRDSRFFADPHFSPEQAEGLYSTWITLDCQGRAAIVFVAALPNDVAVGYISCYVDPRSREGAIGLIGVSASVRGRGIGQSLVDAALHWFREQGVKAVTVITQGRNHAAQRLYQKRGFLTRHLQFWYHKWYSDESPK